jgi:N-acetylmuramoyl-L-alanine amidase
MRRETGDFAADFRSSLLKQMKPKMGLARDPSRSAAFKVLRQPGSPSVLIELGYMSNAEDEKLMASGEWQRGVADAVVKAVGEYFSKRRR